MSIAFEKLSNVSSVDSVADGDYIMTIKDGEVVKVAKSNFTSSFAPFIINLTVTYDESTESYAAVSDKTFAQIVEAYESGLPCFVKESYTGSLINISGILKEDNAITVVVFSGEAIGLSRNDSGDVSWNYRWTDIMFESTGNITYYVD